MRLLSRLLLVLLVGGVIASLTWAGAAWNASRLPGSYRVTDFGMVDSGGGPVSHDREHDHGASVVSFRERADGPADVRLTLEARHARLGLPSGKTVRALTFNGTVPGPELRVRQGDLLEVTLLNRDIEDGVSIHWHGLDVPNAEDGVAGVTQDAVLPGERHVYRFRVNQLGTYWYHSHQNSLEEVERGLYGAFVVEPRSATADGIDRPLIAHRLPGATLLGASDEPERAEAAPGTPVRLRLVNSDNVPRRFGIVGTPFRVAAIDGGEIHRPGLLRDQTLVLAAGGRYDVVFTMPNRAVSVGIRGQRVGLTLSPDGKAALAEPSFGPNFDPAEYGQPQAGLPSGERYDRSFRLDMSRGFGFFAGGFRFGRQWELNGRTYPDVPMFHVRRGELVRMTFENESGADHPMHLHGHHMLVISRNGRPVATPWLVDTLDVRPGERYEVVFRASNPGLWMLHCHNLEHAAEGFMSHVVYEGVRTPFRIGDQTRNAPE